MSLNQLAPAELSQLPSLEAPQTITQLDHMYNYGRAALSTLGDRLASTVDTIRHPNKTLATIETAFALGSGALGTTVALAETTPPANPAARNIHFYKPNDKAGLAALNAAANKCPQGGGLNLNPYSNHRNPTALHHSRYGMGWITKSPDGQTQTVHIRPKKGYTWCFSEVNTLKNDFYILKRSQLTRRKGGFDYIDPYRLNEPNGHAVESFSILFKKVINKK